ncbi:MAG: Anucleate primary sterigmata protein B [Chaenotheca gracillima]|nr:MAG: Anucleate primary sterigmata protein B [Chaenotheca gracillima]
MNGASMPAVKAEQDDHLSAHIKPDPDSVGASPSALSDEDLYEDAGDLDLSKSQFFYLMKIPKWLWESWADIDDDQEIRLGSVKVEQPPEGGPQKMTLNLSPDVKSNQSIPKEYNMNITNPDSTNTYVFSEKDLPGYTNRTGFRPRGGQDQRGGKSGAGRDRKNRRFQPYFRKAIPKQTALAGLVRHEVSCTPVENEEFRQFEKKRTLSAFEKQKPGIQFLKNDNLFIPSKTVENREFGAFTKTGPVKPKPQDNKSARIPQNELLDLIFDCFKRYKYWSLKNLKNELRQPEAYLKSTLDLVAELVKTGRYAMTWTLKPENQTEQYADIEAKEEAAPDIGPGGMDGASDLPDGMPLDEEEDDDDEDDDENVKMEDVMP